MFLLLIVLVIALAGTAVLSPQSLGFVQENVLGVLHGGIVDANEDIYVDNCVPINGQIMAVPRVRRTVRYRDGTELVIIFSERPYSSDAEC
jgi:hypothetical protein